MWHRGGGVIKKHKFACIHSYNGYMNDCTHCNWLTLVLGIGLFWYIDMPSTGHAADPSLNPAVSVKN